MPTPTEAADAYVAACIIEVHTISLETLATLLSESDLVALARFRNQSIIRYCMSAHTPSGFFDARNACRKKRKDYYAEYRQRSAASEETEENSRTDQSRPRGADPDPVGAARLRDEDPNEPDAETPSTRRGRGRPRKHGGGHTEGEGGERGLA